MVRVLFGFPWRQWALAARSLLSVAMAEAALTALALLVLGWVSLGFIGHHHDRGANDRYAIDQALAVTFPAGTRLEGLQANCVSVALGGNDWRASACSSVAQLGEGGAKADATTAIHAQLGVVQTALTNGMPLDEQIDPAQVQLARAGLLPADDEDAGEAATAQAEKDFYRRSYGMANEGGLNPPHGPAGSQLLACAAHWLVPTEATKAPILEGATRAAPAPVVLDDAPLLAAAVLAGQSTAVQRWAQSVKKTKERALGHGQFSEALASRCAAFGTPITVVQRAASMMARAYSSRSTASKAHATGALAGKAWGVMVAYAALGLLLLNIGRRPVYLGAFVPFALMLWALAGWLTGVRLPDAMPAAWHNWFFLLLAGASALIWLMLAALPIHRWGWTLSARQTMSTRVGYAGFVLLVGLGWFLLIDLSANAHPKNRFLALYQQTNVFAAFALVSILPTLRLTFMQKVGRLYALLVAALNAGALTGWRRVLVWGIPCVLVLIPLLTVLRNHRQLTSELLRLWFVLGVSWFMFLRGERVVRAIAGRAYRDMFVLLLPPLALFVGLLVLGQLVTNDLGPLLVTMYGCAVIVGGVGGVWAQQSGAKPWAAWLIGGASMLGLIVFVTGVLFVLGPLHGTTAERIQSLKAPFSAVNDQMAIVHNFRASIPSGGYGLGDTPWCGDLVGGTCAGMPAQVHSDYTLTAFQGVWGFFATTVLLGFLIYWLNHLLKYHDRVASTRLDFSDSQRVGQAWLSWLALCWVALLLAQVAVTVAGNMGWLPLSGITLPFISFGAWTLIFNSAYFALTVNLLPLPLQATSPSYAP